MYIKRNTKKIFTAVVAVIVVCVSVFYACKKDTFFNNGKSQNSQAMMAMGSYSQPTQDIAIQTYFGTGTTYPVTGNAVAGSYNGQIYGCNLTWTMPAGTGNIDIALHATLKPEFDGLTANNALENYTVTINDEAIGADGYHFEVDGDMFTIAPDDISMLWNRVVAICDADVVITPPITITNDFSSINFSKIGHEGGMLKFESLEDYAQTIDALVEICNQYSNKYITALEAKLGCSIDDADEEIVQSYVAADNFFPFNPLMEFIQLVGFTNSAYPVLRAAEIEWMADAARFEAEQNPFDVMGLGYVESALRNIEGYVYIERGLYDEKLGTIINTGTDTGNNCVSSGDNYKDSPIFSYNGKPRKIKAMISTYSINIHARTNAYWQDKHHNWWLWLTRVDMTFGGKKWLFCEDDTRTVTKSKSATDYAGITDRYITFTETPTYIISDGIVRISGIHTCKHYSGKVETQIKK